MPNAALLKELQLTSDGFSSQVIQTDMFSDVVYFIDGFLSSFVYNGVNYIYCQRDYDFIWEEVVKESRITTGYYDEDKYLEYMNPFEKMGISEMYKHNFTYHNKFDKAETGDTIVAVRPEVYPDYTWFWRTVFTWSYDSNGAPVIGGGIDDRYIIIPESAEREREEIEYPFEVTSFYAHHLAVITGSGYPDPILPSVEILARIAISMNNAINITFSPFWSDESCASYIEEQRINWKDKLIGSHINLKALSMYYFALEDYRANVFDNQRTILTTKDPNDKVYVLAQGLSSSALNVMSIDLKKELLDKALYEKLDVLTKNPEHESFVIKMLLSFRDDQTEEIDSILDYLTEYRSKSSTQTKYSNFLNTMSTKSWFGESPLTSAGDWSFQTKWDPDSTKPAFIKALFTIWLKSKYNPYKVGAEEGDYKENIGIRVGSGDTVQYEKPYLNTVILQPDPPPEYINFYTTYENKFSFDSEDKLVYERTDAAPVCLNYQSRKNFLGFYMDNFSFKESGNKIMAFEEYTVPGVAMGELAEEDKYYNVLRGTYELFQPVQLIDVSQETIFPVALSVGEEVDIDGKHINSLIPIFLLKYIDDEGDESDLYNAIGIVADIISLISVVGNVAKLRHLSHLSKLEKAARVIVTGIEVTQEINNFILGYVIDCDSEDCKNLREFSLYLQIATLSFDSLYSAGRVQSAAKKVQNGFDTHGIPTGFNHVPTLQLIQNLADIESYLIRLKDRIIKNVKASIKSQNIKYKMNDLLGIGETVKLPPRFSLKKFTKSVEDVVSGGKTTKVTFYTKTADDLHSEVDFSDMIEHGYDLNLNPSDIEGLILKSHRVMKQVDKLEVITWMDNYDNFLKPVSLGGRGKLIYCFTSQTHFELFAQEYNVLRSQYGMQNIKTITFGGSCTTKLDPPDLDLVHYISPQKFDDLIDHYESVLEKYMKRNSKKDISQTKKRVKNAIANSLKTRKIDTNCMIYFDETNNKLKFFISDLTGVSSMKTLHTSTGKNSFDFSIFDSGVGSGISPEYTFNLE